ncbi:hypothetical protein QNK09_12045 [Brevibacillus agri]|nr:hypothetical protein [Brevibacillus agri]MDN4093554.1 hypothetical protein [Brevibacillus agri]WHX32886.1 hypothetical protein QNK09_12045 [Brevibacillus agri]
MNSYVKYGKKFNFQHEATRKREEETRKKLEKEKREQERQI